ncbi:MAG: hypothetical protein RIA62_04595 [Cyclobacteriaceae bacterium]|tara:strand:- start:12 stop:275 length:264 start_codon:yes stop_codon:yes gene_type:complete
MAASQQTIEKKLIEAKDKLSQLKIEEELVSEIEWCLGSYAHDKNPKGLYEKAEQALNALSKFKKKNDKKVSKKLLDDLTKAIKKNGK